MFNSKSSSRALRRVASASAAIVLAVTMVACGDDDDGADPPDEPAVATDPASPAETTGGTEADDAETDDTEAPASGEPIKVGVVTSLTGPGSVLGQSHKEALEMRVEQINDGGGVDGRQVEMTIVDDESLPDRAVEAVRTMLTTFEPDVILGPTAAATCYATKPVTEQAQMLQYCLSGAPIPTPAPYYFSAFPDSLQNLGDTPAYWASQQDGIESVACLATDDASGQVYEAVVSTGMTGIGLDFVGIERYGAADSDVSAQLTRLRGSDPDLIYSCTTGTSSSVALRGAQALGMDTTWWIPALSPDIGALIKDVLPANGVFGGGYKLDIYEQLPDDDPNKSVIAAFVEDYTAAYGGRPDTFAAAAADALDLMLLAIAETDGSADAAVKYLEDEVSHVGVQTNYDFSADDHRGAEQPAIVLTVDDSGSLSLVDMYPPEELPTNAKMPQ